MLIIIVITIFISIFFTPLISNSSNLNNSFSSDNSGEILDFNANVFVWPIPGYTKISSPFGKRNSPTARSF